MKVPLTPSSAPAPVRPASSPRRLPRLLALSALLLSGAQAAPVALRAVLNSPDGVAVPVSVDLSGPALTGGPRTVRIPVGGTLLDLPEGRYDLRLSSAGARLDQTEVTVGAGGADLTLTVQPDVTVTLDVPESAPVGSTVTARITLRSAYSDTLTLTPELSLDEGLVASPVNLTRTLAAGGTVTAEVPVLIGTAGPLELRLALPGLEEPVTAQVQGTQPGRLIVTATRDLEAAGRATLTVENPGGPLTVPVTLSGADVRVQDEDGQPVTTLTLGEGESRTLTLEGGAGAPGPVTVTLGSAVIRVPLADSRPDLRAALNVSPADPLPGETVTVTLDARNLGAAALSGDLTVQWPAWLTPQDSPAGPLVVPAGGSARREWTARVALGAPESGAVEVSGAGDLAPLNLSAALRRTLLTLRVLPAAPQEAGFGAELPVFVQNPTARPVTVTLGSVAAPPPVAVQAPRVQIRPEADGAPPAPQDETPAEPEDTRPQVTLAPYGSAVARLPYTTAGEGVTTLTVTPEVDGQIAGAPLSGPLTFTARPQPTRSTVITLPFSVRGLTTGSLLAAHLPPEGAAYRAGSSELRVGDRVMALPDPRVGEGGRLYWTLPAGTTGGTLAYTAAHVGVIGAPETLGLSARVGERDLILSGSVDAADAARAAALSATERDGLIRSPRDGVILAEGARTNVTLEGPSNVPVTLKVNGQVIPESLLGEAGQGQGVSRLVYIGLPLSVGENLIEATFGQQSDRVRVRVPGQAERLDLSLEEGVTADGSTPVALLVRTVDAQGLPSGAGQVTLSTDLEPLDPDADPQTAGYQVNLTGGVARVRLEPLSSARNVNVQAALGNLRVGRALFVDVPGETIVTYQASAGVRYSPASGLNFEAQARGYAEVPLLGGALQASADTTGLPALTSAASAGRRFALTGSGTESRTNLSSDLGFAFRYERRDLSLGYYDGALALAPLSSLPRASALRGELRRGPWSVRALAARTPTGSVTETIQPDGGRSYLLSSLPRVGSERVTLIRGASEQTLQAGRDYQLDGLTGRLTLASPLGLYGPDFGPQRLSVAYVPQGAGALELTLGAGLSYAQGPWTLDGGVARTGSEFRYGAQVQYRTLPLTVLASYRLDPEAPRGRFGIDAQYREGPVTASAAYTAEPTPDAATVRGVGEVTYRQATFGVKLQHRVQTGDQRVSLTADRPLDSRWTVGAGAEVVFPTATQGTGLNGVVLARYAQDRTSAEVQHSQPLLGNARPQSRLNVNYRLSSTANLLGRLQQTWGEGGSLIGEVGVQQQLGNANLNVSYQLPGASGQSSRARFGVDVPINVTERIKANVSASVARELSTGLNSATGALGVRYLSETFSASLGVDASRGTDTRLTVRGGATGTLGQHVLSVDSSVQVLPATQAQLTLSHAWRTDRLALLQYHRLGNTDSSSVGTVLEGEIALDAQFPLPRTAAQAEAAPEGEPAAATTPPENAAPARTLSLQPSFAYRVPVTDRQKSTYQGGLSLTVPLTDRLSAGLNSYLISQPGLNSLNLTYGADLRYRVNDNLRVVAGYTAGATGTAAGLTTGANPGVFLRADLSGGR
ncbi:hypothetical protein GCM10017784_17500 [Deinococcus indicus]|uniref:hypothetical protein n=1 Tax=Deinococcus indicus TaxID=223556 RepID=UPI00174C7328|nr:hypothetical protein [Deinococcus indicus]GHG25754.1 hypothetical protein GCM10017784_17500 [Deinococcus indicus]